ncbi:MAG: hypothetical protein ACREQ7_24100 [Candidatus Binatia bacterium]
MVRSTSFYFDKGKMALRYGVGLPRFFFKPLSLADCYALVRKRVEQREENFLAQLRRAVYNNPRSPYLQLLRHAGCEYRDAENMVRQEGLERTLKQLGDSGVYVSIEEFKGRRPIERSGLSFQARPEDFDNPRISATLEKTSGGSRSQGIPTRIEFDFLTDEAAAEGLLFDELGVYGGSFLFYHNILGVFLLSVKSGTPPAHWFLPLSSKKNRLASFYAVWAGRVLGYSLPQPEPISRQEADKVALWLAKRKRMVCKTVVWTSASGAVRVALAAKERALDIADTHFISGSEPLTPVREQIIRGAGCSVTARYATSETGRMGYGCGNSTQDDVHVLKNMVAVISEAREAGSTGITVNAYRITSLLPAAPKIFINMENGDYGKLETRPCGCNFDELGLTDHLSHIRSYEKLTSEGMTFFASDLARIVEEILPATFGGSPLDYQAIEEEGADGIVRVSLLVSPRVGQINEAALVDTVLGELRKNGGSARMMSKVWQEAGTLRVRREDPHPTKSGKVFSFQVETTEKGEEPRRARSISLAAIERRSI